MNAGGIMFHGTTDDTLSRADAALGRHAEARDLQARALATYDRIGARWWHRRLAGQGPGEAIARTPAERRPQLRPTTGGLWAVGEAPVAVNGLLGFGYLAELLRRPGQAVPVLELVGAGRPVVHETGWGEVADRQALQAYHRRLVELDAELDEAGGWADPGRIDALREEREALLDEVRRATGLGGRQRAAGSSQERARVAVRKAITAAIGRIDGVDASLGHHLRNNVHTGFLCSYDPDPGSTLHWLLDSPVPTGAQRPETRRASRAREAGPPPAP